MKNCMCKFYNLCKSYIMYESIFVFNKLQVLEYYEKMRTQMLHIPSPNNTSNYKYGAYLIFFFSQKYGHPKAITNQAISVGSSFSIFTRHIV